MHPVRLVVKAPNQQIEDQIMEVDLNWTVLDLKRHLSNSYPSKPVSFMLKCFSYVLNLFLIDAANQGSEIDLRWPSPK